MRIERYGNGPRCFFGLHGWSGDHRTFAPLLAGIPDEVTFYTADLPGCGASPPPAQWCIDAVADEVAGELAKLPRPVTLVGNCSGANIGFFVAKRIPEHIERMVTIDAFAYWPWYFRVFVNRSFGRYAYKTTFENPVGRWMTDFSLRGKREIDTSLTEGFTRVDHRATYRFLTLLRDSGAVEQFCAFTMPIDITYGEKTFEDVKKSAAQFAKLWPQSRVTCLPNAGHLPIREASEALRDVLFYGKGSMCTTQQAIYAD